MAYPTSENLKLGGSVNLALAQSQRDEAAARLHPWGGDGHAENGAGHHSPAQWRGLQPIRQGAGVGKLTYGKSPLEN